MHSHCTLHRSHPWPGSLPPSTESPDNYCGKQNHTSCFDSSLSLCPLERALVNMSRNCICEQYMSRAFQHVALYCCTPGVMQQSLMQTYGCIKHKTQYGCQGLLKITDSNTYVFHKTHNATYFLFAFLEELRQRKSIQERGAQTGKETVTGWQAVAINVSFHSGKSNGVYSSQVLSFFRCRQTSVE